MLQEKFEKETVNDVTITLHFIYFMPEGDDSLILYVCTVSYYRWRRARDQMKMGIGKGGTVKQAYNGNGFGGLIICLGRSRVKWTDRMESGVLFFGLLYPLRGFNCVVRGRLPNEEDYPICGCLTRTAVAEFEDKIFEFL